MAERKIGLYLIPMDDCHGSEYVSDHFRCIEFVSGFTGSAGTLIITMAGAWLYADGRYYVQAANQLEGSNIKLMKLGSRGVPTPADFIAGLMHEIYESCGIQEGGSRKANSGEPIQNMPAFGFDGNVVNKKYADGLIAKIAAKNHISPENVDIKTDEDLAGMIWDNRPEQECRPAWIIDEQYTGESCSSKLSRIREKLESELAPGENYLYLVSSLDDIAWTFNIRGNDIPENPECFAYAAITRNSATVFLGNAADTADYLNSQGVEIGQYGNDCLKINTDAAVLMDPAGTTFAVYDFYRKNRNRIKYIKTPASFMKGVKNQVELSHACNALLRDSTYVTEFMCWLKKKIRESQPGQPLFNDDGSTMSELSVDDKLDALRTKDPLYIEKSFATIAAYKENGAMMHYQAKPDAYKELSAEGMLLIDSGVQFMDGTTDITRTFILGPVTEEEKKAFTLTAVSMLRLMNARFIEGCTGENLDIMAREPMWAEGWDYKCGTGHGVGHVLNVHEGPHAIRWKIGADGPTAVLKEGMVVTDEPGVYREGKYGIRTENEIYVKAFKETEDGKFLCFEPMTYIPIDLDGIDTKYMTNDDRKLLNDYHRQVFEKLSPLVTEETQKWLKEYTGEI